MRLTRNSFRPHGRFDALEISRRGASDQRYASLEELPTEIPTCGSGRQGARAGLNVMERDAWERPLRCAGRSVTRLGMTPIRNAADLERC